MFDLRRSARAAVATVAVATPLVLAPLADAAPAPAPAATAARATTGTCALSSLPSQARDTVGHIHSGTGFPYPKKDGTVFTNREHALPAQSSSYYHEYTVPTPGSPDRGARRIVTGDTPLTSPAHYYYTGDHYSHFCEVTGAGAR